MQSYSTSKGGEEISPDKQTNKKDVGRDSKKNNLPMLRGFCSENVHHKSQHEPSSHKLLVVSVLQTPILR